MSTEETSDTTTGELRLSILGMRCAGCVSAVEGALASVKGVKSVAVNFADHSALVKGDADADALTQAVRAAGYDAAVMEGLEDPAEQEEQEMQRYRTLMKKAAVAASLGVPLMLADQFGWLPAIGSAAGTMVLARSCPDYPGYSGLLGLAFLHRCYQIPASWADQYGYPDCLGYRFGLVLFFCGY